MSGLLLKGARVIDPGAGLDASLDVLVDGGRIAALGPDLPSNGATVRDCRGLVVTPGLIDGHVHVYEGVGFHGIDPDVIGVGSGVTTVVDAGSSGAATFEGLRRYVLSRAKTRVLVLLHIAMVGTPGGPSFSELSRWDDIDEDAAERVIEANRDVIVGIKVRASPTAVGSQGLEPLRRARALGERLNLPVMVHVGEPHIHGGEFIDIRDVVGILRPGDIVTHLFTAHPGGLLDANGRVHDVVREAYRSGLRFDVGHGLNNVSFDTAARVLDQDIQPHTISTDIHRFARNRVVFDLPTTMAKMLALGFTLPDVVRKATYETAASLNQPDLVSGVAVGKPADLSVFRLEEATWQAEDSMGKTMSAGQKIVPLLAIRGDQVFEALPSASA